jgi:hypothetical protein
MLVGLTALCVGAFMPVVPAHGQAGDSALLDALVKKGVLSDQEAEDIQASEEKDYASTAASKINLSTSIKSITFYGDLRLRFEMRDGTANKGDITGNGTILNHNDSQTRNRDRFRLRVGLKGDLYDQFFYGIRLATGDTYDRSGNVTFGNTDNGGEFGNSSNLIGVDRVYLGWKPTDWLTLTGGKFENPFYTTNLVWDDNLSPSGAAEQFDDTFGDWEVFATAGQFIYGDSADNSINPNSGSTVFNYSDLYMFGEQVGFKYKFDEKTFIKGAASIYTYSGTQSGDGAGSVAGLYSVSPLVLGGNTAGSLTQENNSPAYFTGPFVGAASASETNVTGVNNLAVLEVPLEFDFSIGPGVHTTTSGDPKDMKDMTSTTTGWTLPMRIFTDFAYNFEADERADAARRAILGAEGGTPNTGVTSATPAIVSQTDFQGVLNDGKNFLDQAAYQVGVEVGQLKKKGDWDGKLYWQSTGYYAVDPNLIDADIFNAATNMQGVVVQASHNWTDGLSSTLKYAHGMPVNDRLATPNVNQDLQMSDIHEYNLFQADLMWKF